MSNDFYLRYYVGHKGKFGHEFLEFEFRPDGKLRFVSLKKLIKCVKLFYLTVHLLQVCQQQQLQERHDDPQGGLRPRRRDGRAAQNHRGQRDHGRGRRAVAAAGPRGPPGAGDRDRGRAHQLHHQQDRVPGGRQPVPRPRRSPLFLLSRPGPQVSGVLPHRTPFQDQAHLR